jgi:hypothetical protein
LWRSFPASEMQHQHHHLLCPPTPSLEYTANHHRHTRDPGQVHKGQTILKSAVKPASLSAIGVGGELRGRTEHTTPLNVYYHEHTKVRSHRSTYDGAGTTTTQALHGAFSGIVDTRFAGGVGACYSSWIPGAAGTTSSPVCMVLGVLFWRWFLRAST